MHWKRIITICVLCLSCGLAQRIYAQMSLKDAIALSNEGAKQLDDGRFSEANKNLAIATEAIEKHLGRQNEDYINTLVNLAVSYRACMRYDEAWKCFTAAEQLTNGAFGERSVVYVKLMKQMADFCELCGYFRDALTYYNRALSLMSETGDFGADFQGHIYMGLAATYLSIDDNAAAENFYIKALDVFKCSDEFVPYQIMARNGLINLYTNKNDYANAEAQVAECGKLILLRYGDSSHEYMNLEVSHAELLASQEKWNDALLILSEVMQHQEIFVQDMSLTTSAISLMISCLVAISEFDAAQSMLDVLTTLYKAQNLTFDKSFLKTALIISAAKIMAGKDVDYDKVKQIIALYLDITRSEMHYAFTYLPVAQQKQAYDAKVIEFYVPFFAMQTHQMFAEEIYNCALLSKGVQLCTEQEINSVINASNDAHIQQVYSEAKAVNVKLRELQAASSAANSDSITVLLQQSATLNGELSSYLESRNGSMSFIDVTWQDVKKALAPGDVAIEFFALSVDENKDIIFADIVTPNADKPELFPLAYNHIKDKSESANYNKEFCNLWGLVQMVYPEAKKVYFSPAGVLYNVPLESLPDWEDATKLISDRWNIYRVSSTRELVATHNKQQLNKAVAYGGIEYDTDAETLVADAERYGSTRALGLLKSQVDSLGVRGGVAYLSATKDEVETIKSAFATKNVACKTFEGSAGTEASFKALSGTANNVIHIATHGFYWTESSVAGVSKLNFINNSSWATAEDKALTRSGLLFAGANNVLSGKSVPVGIDDGVLTAQEISQLNFNAVDLVVLSACQTGLGEISGDGVYGLQRGFKKAGAKSLMMSLWQVDDNATQLLMSRFYKNLTSGMSKYESLVDAQCFVREYEVEETVDLNADLTPSQLKQLEREGGSVEPNVVTRKTVPYANPKYWAAFVLLDALN